MIYTYSNDSFLNNNTAKYIDIESNTREKLNNFLTELQNTDLTNLKTNFNTYKNIIRRSIVEAIKLYYKNNFKKFLMTCVKHGTQ